MRLGDRWYFDISMHERTFGLDQFVAGHDARSSVRHVDQAQGSRESVGRREIYG